MCGTVITTLITATLLSSASLTPCLGSCSQFRMWRPRREHITPVLRQLHWLPVSCRIDFKLAVLMHQILRGLASMYLQQDMCRLASEVSSGRRLCSASVPTFVVPCMRTKLGDHSFAAAGPRLQSSLPWPLRQSKTLKTFKRQLKTFLFSD